MAYRTCILNPEYHSGIGLVQIESALICHDARLNAFKLNSGYYFCVVLLLVNIQTVKRPLGYSFRMLGQAVKDSGTIFTIPFIKKRSDTLTRISLVTSFRSYTNVAWQVLIDGQACTSPRNIQTAQHQSDRGNTVTPGTLAGICKATRRGRIGKGRHTISILVKNRHRDDVLTGWNGSSMLEVQEILRP